MAELIFAAYRRVTQVSYLSYDCIEPKLITPMVMDNKQQLPSTVLKCF